MPLGGSLILSLVGIGTAVFGGSQQKKIANQQLDLQKEAIDQNAIIEKAKLNAFGNAQRNADITNLMAGIAQNYQSSVLNADAMAKLETQKQVMYYVIIGGLSLTAISIVYLITHKKAR